MKGPKKPAGSTPRGEQPRRAPALDLFAKAAAEPLPPDPPPAPTETPVEQPTPAAPAPPPVPGPTADVEDGIHPGIDFPTYWSWPRMHHSDLVEFNRSAAHARQAMEHPDVPTPALELGHAVHAAILEPARFAAEFVCGPLIDGRRPDRRTTIGKDAWKRAEAEAGGRELLDVDDWTACTNMRDAVWSHPYARRLLSARGVNEVGMAWTDKPRDVKLKGRLDRFTVLPDGWPAIVDLKTAADGSQRAFERAIADYKYHQQAALYVDGAYELQPVHRRYVFIVVEKAPPFVVAVYELGDDSIDQGRFEYSRNLDTLVRCRKTGQWPGYTEDLELVSLPHWALTVRE
jgi:hypothetical protein